MWTNFRFSLTNVTSFFFNLHSPLQIPGLPLMNDTGPASALQPWTSACHPRPATPPPSPRLPPHPPPSPPPPPWSPLTAAGALSHTSSRGWVQVVHARGATSHPAVTTTVPCFILKVDFQIWFHISNLMHSVASWRMWSTQRASQSPYLVWRCD